MAAGLTFAVSGSSMNSPKNKGSFCPKIFVFCGSHSIAAGVRYNLVHFVLGFLYATIAMCGDSFCAEAREACRMKCIAIHQRHFSSSLWNRLCAKDECIVALGIGCPTSSAT